MAEITGRGNGRWLIGCVADNNWRFLDQSLALVRSLRWFGGAAADCDFRVCVVDSAKPAYIREMSRYGAQVRIVPTYNRDYPVTNKLRFLQQSDLSGYDHILLLDCDTLVVQNPLTPLTSDHLQAKMVPRRSVPHELFEKLFRLFNLPIPERNYEYSVSKELSIPYFNTGVVCLHKRQLSKLVTAWNEIARSAYPLVSARIDRFNQRVLNERAPTISALSPLKARAFEAFGKPNGRAGI